MSHFQLRGKSFTASVLITRRDRHFPFRFRLVTMALAAKTPLRKLCKPSASGKEHKMTKWKKFKIQICDGSNGCGRIIADSYRYPQRCDWTRHEHQSKYRGKIDNAPLMRKMVVREWRDKEKS